MRLAMTSTKGGTGKTTSAVYLATAFHETGRTLLVDADPQGSALLWSQQGDGLPFPTVSLPVSDLHKRLGDLGQGYDHVVIDTPPGDTTIIRSAVIAAEVTLVPVTPTGLDLNRMRPSFELIAETEALTPVEVGVVLTKVRRGTRSARDARAVLSELQYPTFDAEIPLAERYAGSFGTVPTDFGAYAAVFTELTMVPA